MNEGGRREGERRRGEETEREKKKEDKGRAGQKGGIRGAGMSERISSCGSLYDSTNLLLQYCNNGESAVLRPATRARLEESTVNLFRNVHNYSQKCIDNGCSLVLRGCRKKASENPPA